MVGISCEYARNANFVPVRLVCGGITVASTDCAYDPYRRLPFYSKSRHTAADNVTLLVMVVSLPFFAAGVCLQLQALPLSYFRGLIAIPGGLYDVNPALVKGFYSRRYGWQ